MNCLLPLHKHDQYCSRIWHRSKRFPYVRFAVRRASLGQRIELTTRVRELTLQHEFLKAGDITEQLAASLSELLVRKLYLEWGLAAIEGLKIDDEPASAANLTARGPEALVEEIISAIKEESGLNENERKNC